MVVVKARGELALVSTAYVVASRFGSGAASRRIDHVTPARVG